MGDQDEKQRLRLGILSAAGACPSSGADRSNQPSVAQRKPGFVGIARKNVRGLKSNTQGVEVVAVASRSLEKAQAFIKETELPDSVRALGSYDELIADKSIDALYIPLPAGRRTQWVLKAAAAGKHIMCEKPCALVRTSAQRASHR